MCLLLKVIGLLNEPDQLISRQYGRVCAAVITSVGSKNPSLMETLFWQPLISRVNSKNSKEQEAGLSALYKVGMSLGAKWWDIK